MEKNNSAREDNSVGDDTQKASNSTSNVTKNTENNTAAGGNVQDTNSSPEGRETQDADKTSEQKGKTSSGVPDPDKDWLREYFARSLGLRSPPERLLDSVDFSGIAKYVKDGKARNIITMSGAGISTSAGIPDFRTPGTGLYDNLQKYGLPNPQAIFTLDYFKENPKPFFTLAKELYPGSFKPTPCHYFLKMLDDKGLLLRHYTQNIDTLESVAGMNPEKLVEAHGSFRTGHCVEPECRTLHTQEWMKTEIFEDRIPTCTKEGCEGVVKPDIVFFGENLPMRFAMCVQQDFQKCDLLIILGTSLVVQPFASLTARVPDECPRLNINMEKTGASNGHPISVLMFGGGFRFDREDNYRDVFWGGSCDDGCYALADEIGWGDELRKIVKEEHAKIDKANKKLEQKPKSKTPASKQSNSKK